MEGSRIPGATKQLWAEVSNDIDKNQTVDWRTAARSLYAVNEHFSEHEARAFAKRNMYAILSSLIEQNPPLISYIERTRPVELVADIISMDLHIDPDGSLLKCLGLVFDPCKTREMSNLIDVLEFQKGLAKRFADQDGFINLATHMANTLGSPSFPDPKVLTYVVKAVSDGSAEDWQMKSLQNKTAAVVIVKASIDHLAQCDQDYLHKLAEDVSIPTGLMWALLGAVRNEAIATEWDESRFWDLWSCLVLRMIDPELPPKVRKTGWAAWHGLLHWSVQAIHEKEELTVKGAGLSFVNGVYTPFTTDGELEGFRRLVPDGFGEYSGKTLTCSSFILRGQQKWWFLSKCDDEQPGTDRDIDLYQLKNERMYQETGWITCRDYGVDPPPTMHLSGTLGLPLEQAKELPPFRCFNWVQKNSIFAKAESDIAHREYIFESGQPQHLDHLLSLLRYGISEEACKLDLLVDLLRREIFTCLTETGKALKGLELSGVETALTTLLQIMENILTKEDEKYRQIKVKDEHFEQKLGRFQGADDLMKAVGFSRDQGGGVDVYTYRGRSVFALFAAKTIVRKKLILMPIVRANANPLPVAAAGGGVEDPMIQDAIIRSLRDAVGNHGGG